MNKLHRSFYTRYDKKEPSTLHITLPIGVATSYPVYLKKKRGATDAQLDIFKLKSTKVFLKVLKQISRAFSNISSVLPQILTNFVSCWGSFEIFESFFTKSTVLTVQHSLLFYGFSFFNYLPTPRSGSVCYSTSMSLRAAGQLQKGML